MQLRRALGALEEREFRRLWIGQAVSAFGDQLVPVALAFAVLDLTGSASDLGLVLAAQTVPLVAFMLAGGVWADRLRRQRVMLVSDVVRSAAQGLTAALLLSGAVRVWQLIALQAVYGTAQAFFHPASTGLVPQTVSAPRLQQANALLGLSHSASGIAGPAVAGVLVATVGPGLAIAVDAGTFAVSVWFLALLRPVERGRPEPTGRSFLADLRSGWDEFRSRSWLWVSVLQFSSFFLIVLGPYLVVGPAIARRSLGGASAWAIIRAAAGIGSVVGGAVSLRVRPRHPLYAAFLASVAWIPQLALLALAAPALAIAACALLGAAAMTFSATLWFTVLQEHIPPESISRVSAYDWTGSFLFLPLGYALAGPVAGWIGSEATLLFGAGWMVASTLAVLAVPSVRALGRGSETQSSPQLSAAQSPG